METKMKQLKDFLKKTAKDIKEKNIAIKETMRKGVYAGHIQSDVAYLSNAFRHHHIAYCEMRGRKREEIERSREDNLPSEEWIQKVKDKYTDAETLCASS